MADAKLDLKIGQVQFSGEGEQEWLEKMLKLSIEEAKAIPSAPTSHDPASSHAPMVSDSAIAAKSLGGFLKEKDATKVQVRKFLATAVWLEAKGSARITSTEVAKALSAANQSRLANPSDCLNQNVTKGYCEKEGDKFFVTMEGKEFLN